MSFADLIRKRVQDGLQGAVAQSGPFLDVLRELAEGLTSDHVGAAITHGGVRGRYHLTLWPRPLPARRRLVLSFWVTPSSLQVLAQPAQEFDDPVRLRSWLVDFVASPAFLEDLDTLAQIAQHPTAGYLRARRAGHLSHEDVVVDIAADVQSALVAQAEDTAVDITVSLARTAGAGTFDPQRSYIALESSGVRVDDLLIEASPDGFLRIGGIKRTDVDLREDIEEAGQRFNDFDRDLGEREREMQKYGRP